jgi:hypothetical protein
MDETFVEMLEELEGGKKPYSIRAKSFNDINEIMHNKNLMKYLRNGLIGRLVAVQIALTVIDISVSVGIACIQMIYLQPSIDKMNNIIETVNKDIERCSEAQSNVNGSRQLYDELCTRYSTFYPAFKDEIPFNGKTATLGKEFDFRPELLSIATKLETLLLAGYEFKIQEHPQVSSGNSININNENNLHVSLSVTFQEVRSQIQDMTALSTDQITEILLRIDELETISNSKDKRPQKWEQAKGIIKWVGDKGLDVGIKILTLILKAMEV